MAKICSIPGCGKTAKARGWCNMHYLRWWKHGDPETIAHRPFGMSRAEVVQWFSEQATRKGECLLANVAIDDNGYPRVGLDGRIDYLHRLALMEKLGRDLLPGECALHKVDDRNAKNRQAKGSRNGQSVLTEADIPRIRHLLRQGRTLKSVADIYGVDYGTIHCIHIGKTWSHVP